jgi:Protein of unknown function (DUF3717)
MDLTLQELEAAINYWRGRRPAQGAELALSGEVKVLATLYALMIYSGARSVDEQKIDPGARQLLQTWREQQRRPPPLNSVPDASIRKQDVPPQ